MSNPPRRKYKTVPKYALKLLERRSRLSQELMAACNKVDRYCESIGIDIGDTDACLLTDVRIYCESDGAYNITLDAIKRALGIKEEWI